MSLIIGQKIQVRGFVTDEKFIRGQSLQEIERRLGFHLGRLQSGAGFVLLNSYPSLNSFHVRGYSQVAGHHFQRQYGQTVGGLDLMRVKRNVTDHWRDNNVNLVKVLPNTRHDVAMKDNMQYPPGTGIPQWEIDKNYPVDGTVVSVHTDYSLPYRRI
jgi:hypothetical protein